MSDNNAEIAANELDDLVGFLVRSSRLNVGEAKRVIDDVMNFLDELPEEFVRRRHLSLQNQGLSNEEIFARLSNEIGLRRFRAPNFSVRQIRRMIYG